MQLLQALLLALLVLFCTAVYDVKSQCPDTGQFPTNYVCKDCINQQNAIDFMNNPPNKPADTPYILFADKTFAGKPISYTNIGTDMCKITDHVEIWSCRKAKPTSKWTCAPQGFCTAEIKKVSGSGVYKPDATSLDCKCPNPKFERKHVCESCEDAKAALKFLVDSKIKPQKKNPRTVLSGKFTYQELSLTEEYCLVTNPPEVTSWRCTTTDGVVFDNCDDIGYCTEIMSLRNDGHFDYTKSICYKAYLDRKWDNQCETLYQFVCNPDTPASCMVECNMNADCNAFNYKQGALCILKRCPIPYPNAVLTTDHYEAYYE